MPREGFTLNEGFVLREGFTLDQGSILREPSGDTVGAVDKSYLGD